MGVLVIDYCIINCRKLRGLKQHAFIISVSVDQVSGHGLVGSPAQGLTRLNEDGLHSHREAWL